MVPATWILIGSDILTIVVAVMVGVGDIWHINLLANPVVVGVMGVLGAVGISSHLQTTNTTTTTTTTK